MGSNVQPTHIPPLLRDHLKFNCADFLRRTPSGGGEGILLRAAEFPQKIAELIYGPYFQTFFNILPAMPQENKAGSWSGKD